MVGGGQKVIQVGGVQSIQGVFLKHWRRIPFLAPSAPPASELSGSPSSQAFLELFDTHHPVSGPPSQLGNGISLHRVSCHWTVHTAAFTMQRCRLPFHSPCPVALSFYLSAYSNFNESQEDWAWAVSNKIWQIGFQCKRERNNYRNE